MRHARRWSDSPERRELRELYRQVDALLAGWTCACSRAGVGGVPEAQCCHFAVTGREPYPTAVELEEVRHAVKASPPARPDPKRLPMAELRACPLLSRDGRCRIYASRPFGCRTFFCDHAEAPFGAKRKLPRDEVNALGRRIADLSARFAPRDPGPRPLVKALGGRQT
ncbi:MAG TPA: YkgJ family cysteine cluster protein [Polyangiaceae bacterium]|jgi:hypothetical protein